MYDALLAFAWYNRKETINLQQEIEKKTEA